MEPRAPIPLESLAPLPVVNNGRELEKGQYWNQLLTGNLDDVPEALRRKAGAGDDTQPAEERDYRLAAAINRSWVVDHRRLSREEVQRAWPELRRNLAQELGVQNSEQEVYTGLSLQQQELPLREELRRLFRKNYTAALRNEEIAEPEDAVGETARNLALLDREAYLPLAEAVSQGWSALKALDSSDFPLPDLVSGVPGLVQAVDTLAGMEPATRSRVYALARSLDSSRALESSPKGVLGAMKHSLRRGVADLRHHMLQGAGHLGAAMLNIAADGMESSTLRRIADATDRRLQVLDELRQVAQDEVYPISLEEDCGFLEELAVDAAGAVPGAALAFMGMAGFGSLVLAGTGAAVAEARLRSPGVRQELQTFAGLTGAGIQACIYQGMSRIGAQVLNRNINNFLKARNAGAGGYALAGLKALGSLSQETVKLLLAGKAARVAELGMQELAARVDQVASNIDWQNLGESEVDIETNLREAAMNLPYLLIGAGRAALHHFRAPQALLENKTVLETWGVPEKVRQRLLALPDIHAQNIALREALCTNRRWGGAGMLEVALRSLCLLNTGENPAFRDAETARSFLRLPAEPAARNEAAPISRDLNDPATRREVNRLMNGRDTELPNARQAVPYIRLWDEWNRKAAGEWIREPQNLTGSARQFLARSRNTHLVLPRELRLDGYYTPQRAGEVRRILGGQFRELVDLSYQYLMNTESLDSLRLSYKTEQAARTRTEATRREILAQLCSAMEDGIRSGDATQALTGFSNFLNRKYAERRRNSGHAPMWMRKVELAELADGYELARSSLPRINKRKPRELWEAYRIMLGFRSCAEVLMDILPHSPDYQELLNVGYSPADAFTHLLRREMQGQFDTRFWNPPELPATPGNGEEAQRRLAANRQFCERYRQMSGNAPESSPDGEGNLLWRIRRPDGLYTPWFATQEMALNSLAGNVQSLFLPSRPGTLADELKRSQHYAAPESGLSRLAFMNKRRSIPLSGFEQLGRSAAIDWCSRWLGDSTHYSMGLEFVSNRIKWRNQRGTTMQRQIKELPESNDAYLTRLRRDENPLSLARLRFQVYWARQLASGWVKPEQAGQALVEAGLMSPAERDAVLALGEDKPLRVAHLPLEKRREVKLLHKDGVQPGDTERVKAELSRRMAELNVLHLLGHLSTAELPRSVSEWFYASAFLPAAGETRDSARLSAGEVQQLMPQVARLQKQGWPQELAGHLRDAYCPSEAHRLEQGWCFSLGGASAFRSAGQGYWNLLEDPARGWPLLTEGERSSLSESIRDLCRGREPALALQELSEVLGQYPGLRAYAADARQGGQVQRLVLHPLQADPPQTDYSAGGNSLSLQPVTVRKGFSVEPAALPPEWQADARVLPALQLLTELRRQVTASPYADEQGIWWQQERYGGLEGKRPRGVDERWTPEAGLSTFMDFYRRVAALGDTYGALGMLNVCGVPLGGIRPGEIDMTRLNQVTVYRSTRLPEHQVRLMPGAPNAANPHQRKPYVVHTADGVPLFASSMVRYVPDIARSFTPLNDFNSDLERAYDFESNNRWRRRHMEHYLTDLLENRTRTAEAWSLADEGKINNEELFMQMFQDSRLSYYLEQGDPTRLTRGEALAAELGRLMLLAEFGTNREQAVEQLVHFCSKLRADREDRALLRTALNRVVSPAPNRLHPLEQPRPEEDRELDLSPEDAEYY